MYSWLPGELASAIVVPKCAKGVAYTDGPKYLPGLGASAESKIPWGPIILGGALLIGGVAYLLATAPVAT